MALHLILLMKQSLYCVPNFQAELLQETVMLIGHQDHVIWHRWTIFFGVMVKSQVYKNNPQSIPELKDEIIRVVGEIDPQLCQNVIEHIFIVFKMYSYIGCRN